MHQLIATRAVAPIQHRKTQILKRQDIAVLGASADVHFHNFIAEQRGNQDGVPLRI